eukprot:1192564-Prorocentrum_minimum.AAC.1
MRGLPISVLGMAVAGSGDQFELLLMRGPLPLLHRLREGVTRGSRGGHKGVASGSQVGPKGVPRGSQGGRKGGARAAARGV